MLDRQSCSLAVKCQDFVNGLEEFFCFCWAYVVFRLLWRLLHRLWLLLRDGRSRRRGLLRWRLGRYGRDQQEEDEESA